MNVSIFFGVYQDANEFLIRLFFSFTPILFFGIFYLSGCNTILLWFSLVMLDGNRALEPLNTWIYEMFMLHRFAFSPLGHMAAPLSKGLYGGVDLAHV